MVRGIPAEGEQKDDELQDSCRIDVCVGVALGAIPVAQAAALVVHHSVVSA